MASPIDAAVENSSVFILTLDDAKCLALQQMFTLRRHHAVSSTERIAIPTLDSCFPQNGCGIIVSSRPSCLGNTKATEKLKPSKAQTPLLRLEAQEHLSEAADLMPLEKHVPDTQPRSQHIGKLGPRTESCTRSHQCGTPRAPRRLMPTTLARKVPVG